MDLDQLTLVRAFGVAAAPPGLTDKTRRLYRQLSSPPSQQLLGEVVQVVVDPPSVRQAATCHEGSLKQPVVCAQGSYK